jgi:ubiquinone biosynthesis monooxygenase Coq7
MDKRTLSALDQLIMHFDQGLATVFGKAQSVRACPVGVPAAPETGTHGQALAGRLMRVNHAGEVAAQALYRGHALTARTATVRTHMENAAAEENDHLAWCETRITELDSRTSLLNPLWYAGSYAIGALAGRAGDKWSLGFVAETEHQVVKHLDEHLMRLPESDVQSRAILEQMRADEAQHATVAIEAGAAALPVPVKKMMGVLSQIMTRTAYWL